MDQIDLDGEFPQDPLKQQPAQDPAVPALGAAAGQPLWAQIQKATEIKQKSDFDREFNPSPKQLEAQTLASFQAAAERDPDLVAKAQQHARAIGAPLDGAEKNIEVLRSMARVREFADRRLAERNPTLARWLGNIDYAAVASDDVESLQQIDDWFSRVGRQYMSGRQQTQLGYLGEDIKKREGGMPTEVERYRIDALQAAIGRAQGEADWTTALANPVGQMSVTAPTSIAAGYAAAKTVGLVAGPKAAAIAGSVAAGIATFESSRKIEGGTFYLDLIQRGVPPEIARGMSDMHGIVSGGLEAIGGPGFMLSPVRRMIVDAAVEKATGLLVKATRKEAWMQFGKSTLGSTFGEVGTETAQKLSENIFTAMAMELKGKKLDQPLKPEEMVKLTDGLGETIYATMQSMLPLGAVLPGVRVFRDLQGIRKAAGERAWWDGLSDRVANSKLKARAPQAFAELIEKQVEEKGAPENVLIDRRMVRAALRAADAAAVADSTKAAGLNEHEAAKLQGARGKASQELADALGEEVLAQIENDSPLNDTIEVPFSAYTAKVVGTKLHEILRDHIKMDPNGYTLFEANLLSEQARDELQAAKRTIREQGEKQAAWEEERQTVETSIRTQLRNSGVRGMTATNARLSAQVVAASIVQSARRAGMTPVEYWNAHGFRIISEALSPQAIEEALAGRMAPFVGNLKRAETAPTTAPTVTVGAGTELTAAPTQPTEGQAGPEAGAGPGTEQQPPQPPPQQQAQLEQVESLSQVWVHYTTTLGDPALARAAEQVMTEMLGADGVQALRQGQLPAGMSPEASREQAQQAVLAIEDAALRERTAELEADERTDDIFEQTVTLRQNKKSDNPAMWGLPAGYSYSTREVAAALQARQRAKFGTIALNDFSDDAADKLSDWMTEEVLFEASSPKSAIGWYSHRFRAALDRLGSLFPEMRTDEDARGVMTALMAVTSDGQKVAPNLLMAAHIYARYRSGGATPGKLTTLRGHNRGSIPGNLEVLQGMFDRMGVKESLKFLMSEGPVTVLRDAAAKYPEFVKFESEYTVDTVVPMSAMFLGPKLGMFFANLMGSSGYLTMDMWWSRTFNRYRGNLLLVARQSGLDKLAALLGDPSMAQEQILSEAFRLQKLYERAGFKSDLVKLMGRQQPKTKEGTAEWMAEAKRRAGDNWEAMLLQHQRYRAANTVARDTKGTRDQPGGANDRAFMIRTAKLAQEKLKARGLDVSIADIQAALWYYEKRLYAKLGARGTQDISYEEAAGRAVALAADPSRPDGLGGLATALDAGERDRSERKREAEEGGGVSDVADGSADAEDSYLGDADPSDDPDSPSQLSFYERQFDVGSTPDFVGWDDLGELAQDEGEAEQAAPAEEGPVRVLIDLTATIEGAETERLQIGKLKVNSMQDLAEAAAHLALQAREQMQGIVTDDKGKVLGVIGAARGTTSMALADKGMLLDLMMFPNARNVWWVHNHPSGDSTLSDEDIAVAHSMSAVLSSTTVFSRGIMAIGTPTGGSSTWQFYEAYYGKKTNGSVQAPDRNTKYKTTRLLERRLLDVRPGKPVTNSAELTQYLRDTPAEGKDAIVLFDVKQRPVGVLGIDGYAWDEMRKDGRMHTLMTYLARSNAERATLIRVTSTYSGTNNLSWALGSLGINVIVPHNWDAATRSVAYDHNFTAVKKRTDIFAQDDEDYRGAHRAPTSHSGTRIDRLDELYPDDIYGPADRAARYYGHGDSALDRATVGTLQALRGRPDAMVRIYRAVPAEVQKINAGDWVTVSRAYAEQHGQGFDVPWHIIEMDVPAKTLWMSGDSIHEQGYDPDEGVEMLAQDDDAPPPPRAQRTLYAQKNISWSEKTFNALQADGLAAPSIGVASTRAPYNDFGEITLIGKPSLVSPLKNPVFSADAWTPAPDIKVEEYSPAIHDANSWEGSVSDRFFGIVNEEAQAKGAWPSMLTDWANFSDMVRDNTADFNALRDMRMGQWHLQASLLDDEARLRSVSQMQRQETGLELTYRADYASDAIEFACLLPEMQALGRARIAGYPPINNAAYWLFQKHFNSFGLNEWATAAVQGNSHMQALIDQKSIGVGSQEILNRLQLILNAKQTLQNIVAQIDESVLEQVRRWSWDHRFLWERQLPAEMDNQWTDLLQLHAATAGWAMDPAIRRLGEYVAQVAQMVDENSFVAAQKAGAFADVDAAKQDKAKLEVRKRMRLGNLSGQHNLSDPNFWRTTEGVVALATALQTLKQHQAGSKKALWELLGTDVASPVRSKFGPVIQYSRQVVVDQQAEDPDAQAVMRPDLIPGEQAALARLNAAYGHARRRTMVRNANGDYVPATAANIAASLAAKGRLNAPGVDSEAEVRARLAQRFDTWEQMIAAADMIVSNDKHRESVRQFKDKLREVSGIVLTAQEEVVFDWLSDPAQAATLTRRLKHDFGQYAAWPEFARRNNAGNILQTWGRALRPAESHEVVYMLVDKVLSQLPYDQQDNAATITKLLAPFTTATHQNPDVQRTTIPAVPPKARAKFAVALRDLVRAARDVRVDYWESKPQRMVQLDEFVAVVVPQSITDPNHYRIKQTMQFLNAANSKGLKVVTYDDSSVTIGTREARANAVRNTVRDLDAAGTPVLFQDEDTPPPGDPLAPGKPGFFSATEQWILQSPKEEMTVAQWQQHFKTALNKGWLRQAEVEWLDVFKVLENTAPKPLESKVKLTRGDLLKQLDLVDVSTVYQGMTRHSTEALNTDYLKNQDKARDLLMAIPEFIEVWPSPRHTGPVRGVYVELRNPATADGSMVPFAFAKRDLPKFDQINWRPFMGPRTQSMARDIEGIKIILFDDGDHSFANQTADKPGQYVVAVTASVSGVRGSQSGLPHDTWLSDVTVRLYVDYNGETSKDMSSGRNINRVEFEVENGPSKQALQELVDQEAFQENFLDSLVLVGSSMPDSSDMSKWKTMRKEMQNMAKQLSQGFAPGVRSTDLTGQLYSYMKRWEHIEMFGVGNVGPTSEQLQAIANQVYPAIADARTFLENPAHQFTGAESFDLTDPQHDYDRTPGPATDPWNLIVRWETNTVSEEWKTHWDFNNPLVHIRGDKRTTADNDKLKLLYVHEVQSDWAQKAQRVGLAGQEKQDLSRGLALEWLINERAFARTSNEEWGHLHAMLAREWGQPYRSDLGSAYDELRAATTSEGAKKLADVYEGKLQGDPLSQTHVLPADVQRIVKDLQTLAKAKAKDLQFGTDDFGRFYAQLLAEQKAITDRQIGAQGDVYQLSEGPFVANNDAAIELGIKRAIMAAVAENVDAVGFGTAETQELKAAGGQRPDWNVQLIPWLRPGNKPGTYTFDGYGDTDANGWMVAEGRGANVKLSPFEEWVKQANVTEEQRKQWRDYLAFAGPRRMKTFRSENMFGRHTADAMTAEAWIYMVSVPFEMPRIPGHTPIPIRDRDRAVTYRRVEAAAKRLADKMGGVVSKRALSIGAERAGTLAIENPALIAKAETWLNDFMDARDEVLQAVIQVAQSQPEFGPDQEWLRTSNDQVVQDAKQLLADSQPTRDAQLEMFYESAFRKWTIDQVTDNLPSVVKSSERSNVFDLVDHLPLHGRRLDGEMDTFTVRQWKNFFVLQWSLSWRASNGEAPRLILDKTFPPLSPEWEALRQAIDRWADVWAQIVPLQNEGDQAAQAAQDVPVTVNIPVIELTPAMRAATNRGMPLWSSEGSRGRRGAFLPKLMSMLLFRKADLTTTLHELSHWYLVDLLQSAKDPNAAAEVRAEVSAILEWMGVGTVEEFEALSQAQQVQLHERWAYMFEAWLSHGDAPSMELREAFAAIRGWMRDVYGDTVLAMNERYKRKFGQDLPGLDPKVRQLFSRMMASDQELAEMEMVREAMPLYSTQEESGMDDARWAEYQQRVREAQSAAQSRMDKAAMKEVELVNSARAKVVKAIEAEADKLRGKIAAEVRADLSSQPVYRLLTYLATGRFSDDPTEGQVTRYQIDHDRAKELVGEDAWKALVQRYGYGAGKVFGSGRDPEELASEFGFTSGQAMLEELRKAPTLDTAVQDATNERMLKQHSEFMDPDKKEDLISAALNSEARERLVAFEVGVLADAARRIADQVTGATRVGTAAEQRLDTIREDLAAARLQARQVEQERVQSDEERAARQRLEAIRSELATLRQQDETPDGLKRIEDLVAERRRLNQRIEGMLPENARVAQDRVRELETLQRQAQRIAAGPITSERLLAAAAQEAAREVVDTTPVRELRRLRQRAEQSAMSAARRAREAQRKGDVFGALEAGRDRLRAFAIARQAGQALEEVERGKKAVKRLWQQRDDEVTAKRRDVDVVLAARALAAAYRMGTAVRNERDYMANLRKYNPERAAEFEDMLAAARQRGGDYRSMSMRDLRQVWRQIESLWEQSRRDQLAEIAGRQVEQSVLTSQLVGDLQKLAPKDQQTIRSQATSRTKLNKHISSIKAWLRRVESWARSVGPAWQRYIYRPVQERVTAYRLKSSAEVRIYEQALRQIVPTLRRGKIEWQGYWTFGAGNGGQGMLEVLGALMHCGNDSNYRKLLLGYGWGEERADGTIDDTKFREFLQQLWDKGDLRQEHMQWVQGVWDQLERLKPAAQEAHRQVFGTYFEEVPARAFEGPWGSLRGGYVPAKVDRNFADPGMQRYDNMEELRTDFRSSMPATASGFRHSRVEAYTKRLNLDPSMVARHIDEQIRFSMLQPVIQQTLRLLNNDEVTTLLGVVDSSAKELMLIPWLTRVANQSTTRRSALPAWDRFWSAITRNAVLSTMFGNVSVALQNVANFFPAMTLVPAPHIAREFAAYWRNPLQFTRDVRRDSDYMRAKVEADMNRLVARIRSLETGEGAVGRALTEAQVHSQFLAQSTQAWGEVIVWRAAYQHFLTKRTDWADEAELHREAVAHADSVVRESQGANDPESVAAYATGTPFVKAMLVFTNYFNGLANLNASNFAKLFREMGWRGVYSPRTAMAWFLGMAAPMFVGEAISRLLAGRWEDEEDDDWTDPVVRAFGWSQWSLLSSSLPGIAPGLRGVMSGFDDAPWNDRIDVSPVISALTTATVGVAKSIRRIGEGEEWTFKNLHDAATAMTVWSGVPFSVATRTARMLGAGE